MLDFHGRSETQRPQTKGGPFLHLDPTLNPKPQTSSSKRSKGTVSMVFPSKPKNLWRVFVLRRFGCWTYPHFLQLPPFLF